MQCNTTQTGIHAVELSHLGFAFTGNVSVFQILKLSSAMLDWFLTKELTQAFTACTKRPMRTHVRQAAATCTSVSSSKNVHEHNCRGDVSEVT